MSPKPCTSHKREFVNNDENSRDAIEMQFAIREWLHQLVTWRHLTILAAVILLFVWIAPF